MTLYREKDMNFKNTENRKGKTSEQKIPEWWIGADKHKLKDCGLPI